MPCRLSGLVQQEGAAKEAAVNTGFQLRAQVDDLLQRLSTSVASQDAARHELCVYKQQVSAGNILVPLPGMEMFSICN